MLNNATGFDRIYIACGYTDLRQGIDGLTAVIRRQLGVDPFQKNVLFMFCGRKPDKIKCLIWEGDGFLLLYKRLLDGRYQWPRSKQEVMEMTQEQFEWLMSGQTIMPTIRKTKPKNTLEPARCNHEWKCIHHPEEGHWRAGIICDCGWTVYGDPSELTALWNAHSASYPPAESLFDHGGFGSMDEWIVDKPAYDEWVCRLCGEPKP